jgi:STE24 endopeptidase
MINAILDLPFSLWRTFRIEAKFGFNNTTPQRYIADLLLQLVISLALGVPLLWAILWLMQESGPLWWLSVWVVWVLFSLIVSWIFPTLIAPLFNRFTPLEDASLVQRLDDLLERCGFSSKGVFVMDGSRRSSHGNAYFTGFGRSKRIVFFDTLLETLENEEVEAVLAHELGHFKRHHVRKGMLLMAAASFVGLALLGWLIEQPWFFHGLGVSQMGNAVALLLFLLVTPVFTIFLTPLFAM